MPIVSAYTIYENINEGFYNLTYAEHDYNGVKQNYTFETFNMYCIGRHNYTENILCEKENYINYIDMEMTKNIDIGLYTPPNVDDNTYSEDSIDGFFLTWVKNIVAKILNRITGAEDKINILEAELCKKDNTYSFCIHN